MTPKRLIILGSVCCCCFLTGIFGARLFLSGTQSITPNRGTPLPAAAAVPPTSLTRTLQKQPVMASFERSRSARNGDPASVLRELLARRSEFSAQQWLAEVDAVVRYAKPHLTEEYRGRLARWEDPTGRIRNALFGLWQKDNTGTELKRYVDTLPNRAAIYELLAEVNPTGDWVTTADFFVGLSDLTEADHARITEVVFQRWTAAEGTDVATAWLDQRSEERRLDRARAIVSVSSRGAFPASRVLDPGLRELTDLEIRARLP